MRTLFLLLVLVAPPLARGAAAQNALEEAKAQYAAAAYEEALSILTRADAAPAANRVEVEQYRAFCFIALGQIPDAEKAVASLVAADPKYIPSDTVASPKVLSLFSDMRRKELPRVVRRLFDEGRAAFKDKEYEKSQKQLGLMLELLDDPAVKARPENEDLRVLAQGFLTLAAAETEAAAEPPQPAAPEPARLAPDAAPAVIEPPVAVQQAMPEWIPPDPIAASREYVGSMKVLIGTDGRVKAATIERPTYPTYDTRLLQASRNWVYRPATRNGAPVESEKVIAILLRRRD